MTATQPTRSAESHHIALVDAGFIGRVKLADVPAPLRASLYAAVDAGLARYDGCVTHGATGITSFFYIYC